MIRTLILWGAITWYAGPYVNGPLRCGDTYDTSHAWLAVDIDATGWRCGDLVQIVAGDVQLLLPVRDSGPLSLYCVDTGDTCTPIVADLPAHLWQWTGLSVRGSVENVTAGLRQRMEVER